MADKDPMPETPDIKTKTTERKPVVGAGGISGAEPSGDLARLDSAVLAAGGGGFVRAGGITLDVGTDVTDQLNEAIPAFGNVITAIGNGVASSQTALDNSVITTVKKLNDTKITVVTDVVEVLNDDGLPDASKTKLITEDLSVLNFFTPTLHEWKNVQISMDLEVGSFHQDQGFSFSKDQQKSSVTTTGLFWGFVGWFDYDSSEKSTFTSSASSQDTNWKQGQIRVDALLGPRNTGKFPVPASVQIGPQIFVSQGAVVETKTGDVVTARSVDVAIEVRKASGAVNPNVNIILDSGGLLPSFPAGSSTDANGKVKVTLTRNISAGFGGFNKFNLSISLGQMRKGFSVTL